MEDARLLQKTGVSALVLEGIPSALAKKITQSLTIPTIGIGAGIYCDGQILVLDDVLGLSPTSPPKFVKQYAQLHKEVDQALAQYRKEVEKKSFPSNTHSYS